MKKISPIVIMVIAVVIFGGLIWWQQSKTPKEDLKIGVVAPLTGTPALWGQGSLDMMNLAVDEINARGGIKGRKIVLIVEDGKCQSEPAVSAVKKLISQDGVKFILGGHCSPETASMAPVLEENKVFGLAGVSTATGILDNYSYVFRTSPANLVQAQLIAQLAIKKYGLKNISLITEQTAFAKSISADFVTAFKASGGNIVGEEKVVSDQRDFRTELLKIKSANPDAIFVSPQSPAVGIEIVKQINELGIDARLTGNTVFISEKVSKDSGNLIPEDAFTVGPFTDPSIAKTGKLIEKYRKSYGKDVPYNNFFVGAAYDGVYMIKDAISKCGEDPTCVKDYFSGIRNYRGAAATFNFDKNGDPQINVWREQGIKSGQAVFTEITL